MDVQGQAKSLRGKGVMLYTRLALPGRSSPHVQMLQAIFKLITSIYYYYYCYTSRKYW